MLYGAVLVLEVCVLVYCALDIISTPAERARHLPKLLWLALVLLFPIVGGAAWLLAGRPPGPLRALPYKGAGPATPQVPRRPVSPDDDEDFLRRLRERAEEQRRAARPQEDPPPA